MNTVAEKIRSKAITQVRKITTSIPEPDPKHQEFLEEFNQEMERIRSNPDNEKASRGRAAILNHYYQKDLLAFKQEVECAFREIRDPGIARGLYLRLMHEIRRDEEKSFLREQARNASAIKGLVSTEHAVAAQTNEEPSDSTRQVGKVVEWEDVRIEIISEDALSIRLGAAGRARRYNVTEARFKDGRTGRPVIAWSILLALAEHGEISWSNPVKVSLQNAVKKAIELLRKRLRELTGLTGDPFLPYRKEKAWRPRFILRDRSYGGKGLAVGRTSDSN